MSSRHCIGKRNTRLYPALPTRKSLWLVAVVLRFSPTPARFFSVSSVARLLISLCAGRGGLSLLCFIFSCVVAVALRCRGWWWLLRTSWNTKAQTPGDRESCFYSIASCSRCLSLTHRRKRETTLAFALRDCILVFFSLVLLTACPGRVIIKCSSSRCFHHR